MKNCLFSVLALGLLSSPLYAAPENVYKKSDSVPTAQEWDTECFTKLSDEQRELVVRFFKVTDSLMKKMIAAPDKGADACLSACLNFENFYRVIPSILTPRADMYRYVSYVTQALQVLPDMLEIQQYIIAIVPQDAQTEEDIKKSISKWLRAKKNKEDLVAMIQKEYNVFKVYLDYVTKAYPSLMTKEMDSWTQNFVNELQQSAKKSAE
jgi:hypothetical protein